MLFELGVGIKRRYMFQFDTILCTSQIFLQLHTYIQYLNRIYLRSILDSPEVQTALFVDKLAE